MPKLTLYYRQGCHLCEDFVLGLQELLGSQSTELEQIDIDTVPALTTQYGNLVPVLFDAQHRELCRYVLDWQRVETYLSQG